VSTTEAPLQVMSTALAPITGGELELLKKAVVDPQAVKQSLMMRDALTPEQKVEAREAAAQAYVDIKANDAVFVVYGSDATEEFDDIGRRLLQQVGGKDIGAIKELLKGMNDGMRKIQRGYDVKNSTEARERYEKYMDNGLKRLFRRGRDFFEMMVEDFQKFDTQLEGAVKDLSRHQEEQMRNLGYYNELYEADLRAVDLLIFTIAKMEYIAELAATEAANIVVDESQPDWLNKREERDRLAGIASNMQAKIGDFKGVYIIAVATAPQIRISSNQILGVISKLETTKTQVIGAMRRVLAQWIMLIKTKNATELANFVNETANTWTQLYFENAPELIKQIAEGVQKPAFDADLIPIMVKAIEDSGVAVAEALQQGYDDRLALDDAIRTALPQINAAGAKLSDETIKHVLGPIIKAATEPLEIAQSAS
jgi:uncharacterized protein YaaN involved in tellurite resistance